ncbi:MAG: hypothetical protein WD469_04020, partial [Paenibacillaceae bacterium]
YVSTAYELLSLQIIGNAGFYCLFTVFLLSFFILFRVFCVRFFLSLYLFHTMLASGVISFPLNNNLSNKEFFLANFSHQS